MAPVALSSSEPSKELGPSLFSIDFCNAVGRRILEGLYIEEGFVAGGGIDMLALPMLPPIVPTSANRLFLLGTAAFWVAVSNE